MALLERETAQKMVETKLTAAEEKILDKAKELEKSADALTAKDEEILAAARELEDKERAHESTRQRIAQIEGLKAEIESELTAKEKIILLQADELRRKEEEGKAALTKAEQKILEQSRALEERKNAAAVAQKKQDDNEGELARLRLELSQLKGRNETLDEELREARADLREMEEERSRSLLSSCREGGSGCALM